MHLKWKYEDADMLLLLYFQLLGSNFESENIDWLNPGLDGGSADGLS